MRKLIRDILTNIGVKTTQEAADGLAGIEAIRMFAPDIVVLDWEMPMLNGAEMVRIVRSPGVFPQPDVPIIMLTGHVERWRIVEATRLGVHEFLKKPVSGNALLERIVSILMQPRRMVQIGDYYGPEPRRVDARPRGRGGPPPAHGRAQGGAAGAAGGALSLRAGVLRFPVDHTKSGLIGQKPHHDARRHGRGGARSPRRCRAASGDAHRQGTLQPRLRRCVSATYAVIRPAFPRYMLPSVAGLVPITDTCATQNILGGAQ